MSSMFATPEQAEAFSDSLRDVMARGHVTIDPQGSYARRKLAGVEIPLRLAQYLPTGLETPPYGDITVTFPVATMSRERQPSLKLAWEHDPSFDASLEGMDLGLAPDMDTSQRGWPFTIWRADPRAGTMEKTSGFVEQLPSSFFHEVSPGSEESFRRIDEAADRLRIAHTQAEAEAWRNAEMGITNPRISFTEAGILIDFVKSVRR